MARVKIVLDHKGMGEVLNSPLVRMAVHELADAVGETVKEIVGSKYPVNVDTRMTVGMKQDRERSDIAIVHPAALALQAKHGALTRAAAAHGLEVRERVTE
jgi:hypothetical protein